MPVAPYQPDLFEKCKEIYQFLSGCQRAAGQSQHSKLANISFRLPAIAPWRILAALGHTEQVQFYYDHVAQQRSVVGLDAAIAYQAAGASRFARIQQFIQVWRKRVLYATQPPSATLRFFCGFTFFATTTDKAFAPAQVFVPRLQVATEADRSIVSFNCLIDDAVNVARVAEEIGQQLQQLKDLAEQPPAAIADAERVCKVVKDIGDFEQVVSTALAVIRRQAVHKVVLAEPMEVLSATPFNLPASLRALRQSHPDCHIFCVSNGQGQSFMGASPERLLSIAQRELVTDALAGSASRGSSAAVDRRLAQQLQQSRKERYEHRVVVEFIVQQLRSLGLTPQFSHQPQLLQLLNIQHLHTPIRARLHPETEALEILEQLHPTPAVAGLPGTEAQQLIQQLESFERGLYAAPIGWIDAAGNSEFIVGIRSALIQGRQARLYAGAGIVAGSDPRRELAEIRLKLQPLLGALV
ncbi:MAG: isochorismate synthase [Leptolyngbya sp. SIO4C1]|nr:isochorismate synthase [Leptolyngbya sp. SIO4C1]